LGQQVTLDQPFLDEDGKQVKLGDYFGPRPVIVILGYYRCPMLCSVVAEGLIRCLRTLPLEPGRDFEIVLVSIDPDETPEMALKKRDSYVKAYDRPGAAKHWHCLTGPKASIDVLAKQLGFKYFRDEASGQYQHAGAVHILSPTGKITRYFFADYTALDLRLSLAESAENKTGSLQDQILRLCYSYDPTTGRYGLAIITILRLGGVLTVTALAAFIVLNLRREKLRKSALLGRA
jgi:protein SCO1/2